MWWECGDCGGHVERARAPVFCRECGTAGVVFVPAEVNQDTGDPEADSLRAAWLEAGLEHARATRAA